MQLYLQRKRFFWRLIPKKTTHSSGKPSFVRDGISRQDKECRIVCLGGVKQSNKRHSELNHDYISQ